MGQVVAFSGGKDSTATALLLHERGEGEVWEEQTGHTFRSPSRDSWPAAMKDMRARFEAGEVPKRSVPREKACRVCSL